MNDGRVRFGALLARALKVRTMKQEDLAVLLGTTQSSISGWINGKYEPAAATVFTIERTLNMEPGYLSRVLGYLPVQAESRPVRVDAVIAESSLLDDEDKAVLISLFELLAAKQARSTAPAPGAKLAIGPRATLSAAPPPKRRPTARTAAGTAAGGH